MSLVRVSVYERTIRRTSVERTPTRSSEIKMRGKWSAGGW